MYLGGIGRIRFVLVESRRILSRSEFWLPASLLCSIEFFSLWDSTECENASLNTDCTDLFPSCCWNFMSAYRQRLWGTPLIIDVCRKIYLVKLARVVLFKTDKEGVRVLSLRLM